MKPVNHPYIFREYAEKLKLQAERLLTGTHCKEMVSTEAQEKEIMFLKQTLHYEKFFFVFDIFRSDIQHANGINKMLGYNDEIFTAKKFLSIIHPSHLFVKMLFHYELLEAFLSGIRPIKFMGFCMTNILALKHLNGNYLLFKCSSWPFQYDEKQRLLCSLNEFTLVGPFNNEPCNIRLNEMDKNIAQLYHEVIMKCKDLFELYGPFSKKEQLVLVTCAYNPSITSSKIASLLAVRESTIITYKKRILAKAERLFEIPFRTARDVAVYLRESLLI